MKTVDAIAQILKREGVEFLSAFPTTPIIEAAAEAGIRPIICRQERGGVGIADGYSRVKNGNLPGVFVCQHGPGAENAFSGVATAYSDSSPVLLLPLGYPRGSDGRPPNFSSVRNYALTTKSVERINMEGQIVETMRRAFSKLKMGRPGPVMVEVPLDIAVQDVDPSILDSYSPVKATITQANPQDILDAAKALLQAKNPIIQAGQGVLYAGASQELVEIADLLQIPVMTTLLGKSAFPEKHPLSLGSGSDVMNRMVYHFLGNTDLIFGIGTSLNKGGPQTPKGKIFIQATNDPLDINKDYSVDYPIIGDAKLVLRQFIEACRDLLGNRPRKDGDSVAKEIASVERSWLKEWMPKLTSDEVPISPYRVIWEFMKNINPEEAIVSNDSGNPRSQLLPFYKSAGPRTFLGWGNSHALGTSLPLIIGAKLAAPDKFVVNFMGDAAFGMTGLDFETAVRNNIPILTIVLNNNGMASPQTGFTATLPGYGIRDLSGSYSDLAKAMGGWAERVENPSEVGLAILRARKATQEGRAALLEFITSREVATSYKKKATFSVR